MLKARLNEVDFPLPLFAGELLIRYRVEIRVQAFSNASFIVIYQAEPPSSRNGTRSADSNETQISSTNGWFPPWLRLR